ncbi:MAG: AsmA family protein, partial [Muribaculaceae bacterium]|nr:AsmA family protein [Muribaculaceae bacterium]
MKKAWNIFKVTLFTLVFTLIAVPVSLYIILSTQWAQNDIRKVAVSELSALLGTDVSLGQIEIHPFNRLSIHDITALDDNGNTALSVEEVSVAFELFYLLRTGRLVIDFALIDGPDVALYKATKDSPLNIAEILSNLKSDKPARQSRYDLKVNTVIIRNGKMNYDILDAPRRDSVFDINHLCFKDVFLNAYIPRISNNEYRVEIDRFSFAESNSIRLQDLKAVAHVTPTSSTLEHLTIVFPHSSLSFSPVTLDYHNFSDLYEEFINKGVTIDIMPGSIIYPPDFSGFAIGLNNLTDSVEITLNANIAANSLQIDRLTLSQINEKFSGTLSANIDSLSSGVDADYTLYDLRFSASQAGINTLLKLLPESTQNKVAKQLSGLKPSAYLSLSVSASGKIKDSNANARLALGDNALTLSAHYSTPDTFKTVTLKSNAKLTFDDLTFVKSPNAPTALRGHLTANARLKGKNHTLSANLDSAYVTYKGHRYGRLSIKVDSDPTNLSGEIYSEDPDINFGGQCALQLNKGHKTIEASLD